VVYYSFTPCAWQLRRDRQLQILDYNTESENILPLKKHYPAYASDLG
jgi:hypothetical protein